MAENATIDDEVTEDVPSSVSMTPSTVPVSMPGVGTVLALWLPTPSRRRLIDADLEIVEDVAEGPSLILASTRGPAARRTSIKEMSASAPVVVVCHPGGEHAAAEMIAHGAIMVVAEGAEVTAVRALDGSESEHVLEAYLSEMDRFWAGGAASVDAITGLASSSSFEIRLAELGKDGGMPRLGMVDLGFDAIGRTLGPSGEAGLKRRLAITMESAIRAGGGEVFDLGDRLAVVALGLSMKNAKSLGATLVGIGTAFAPAGDPMQLAVGWAGPESASDPGSLRLLAERALDVARTREEHVVDAEEMSEHSAASIELAALFGIADLVDSLDPRGDHSARVSEYAADLARELQLEQAEVAAIGLAGRLHDIGKAPWGAAAFDPTSEDHGSAQIDHPERGEKMIRPSAGATVADLVRAHHERWDGAGIPDGLAASDVPIGARLLAVAHMYDELVSSGTPMADIEQRLRAEAGAALDPDLVETAVALFVQG